MSIDLTYLLPLVGVLGVEQTDLALTRAVVHVTARGEAATVHAGVRHVVGRVQGVGDAVLEDGGSLSIHGLGHHDELVDAFAQKLILELKFFRELKLCFFSLSSTLLLVSLGWGFADSSNQIFGFAEGPVGLRGRFFPLFWLLLLLSLSISELEDFSLHFLLSPLESVEGLPSWLSAKGHCSRGVWARDLVPIRVFFPRWALGLGRWPPVLLFKKLPE
mmetsp:Transcript_35592/g.54413  ORF Transcript_35592/g.54413 Transcript_35592/m.54413 type:complete len:218 (+) Transcript_35592:1473-2126(+)